MDTVQARGLCGASDSANLESAFNTRAAVLTHDGEFGRLAVAHNRGIVGVIYLRPGHIGREFVFEAIETAQAISATLNSVPAHDRTSGRQHQATTPLAAAFAERQLTLGSATRSERWRLAQLGRSRSTDAASC